MVRHLKDALNARLSEAMVQRRRQVEHNEGTAVDAHANHVPNITVLRRPHHQYGESGNAQRSSESVGDAVGNLFPEGSRLREWGSGFGRFRFS